MELVNATPMSASFCVALDVEGREHLVVAAKGTFSLGPDAPMDLADEQQPLTVADEFKGEAGKSATLREADFVLRKPMCDVLVLGAAHAAGGRAVTSLVAGIRVGAMSKSVEVVGRRVWERTTVSIDPSPPAPFTCLPIDYGAAYGGWDLVRGDSSRASTYGRNPIGVGYYPHSSGGDLVGRPLATTQERGRPATHPNGNYPPMALGPLGRNFEPRRAYAGTYDATWLEDACPFLPADFDHRYHQSAPVDQQIPWPRGGEPVELVNLSPHGTLRVLLPTTDLSVEFTTKDGRQQETAAVVDTIVFEPDADRATFTWRSSMPLRRNVHEVAKVVVGRMPPGFYRARERRKAWVPLGKRGPG